MRTHSDRPEKSARKLVTKRFIEELGALDSSSSLHCEAERLRRFITSPVGRRALKLLAARHARIVIARSEYSLSPTQSESAVCYLSSNGLEVASEMQGMFRAFVANPSSLDRPARACTAEDAVRMYRSTIDCKCRPPLISFLVGELKRIAQNA